MNMFNTYMNDPQHKYVVSYTIDNVYMVQSKLFGFPLFMKIEKGMKKIAMLLQMSSHIPNSYSEKIHSFVYANVMSINIDTIRYNMTTQTKTPTMISITQNTKTIKLNGYFDSWFNYWSSVSTQYNREKNIMLVKCDNIIKEVESLENETKCVVTVENEKIVCDTGILQMIYTLDDVELTQKLLTSSEKLKLFKKSSWRSMKT